MLRQQRRVCAGSASPTRCVPGLWQRAMSRSGQSTLFDYFQGAKDQSGQSGQSYTEGTDLSTDGELHGDSRSGTESESDFEQLQDHSETDELHDDAFGGPGNRQDITVNEPRGATTIEGLRSKTELKRFLVSGDIRTLKNNCTVNLEYDVYARLYEDTCVISTCSR